MYHKIDNNGFYLGISKETNNGMEFFTEVPIVGNFVKFKFDGINWVEGAIQSEIDERDNSEDATDLEIAEGLGLELYQRTKRRLIRRIKRGVITRPQAKRVRTILNPIFQFLKTGDLDIANDMAIALAVDTNANVQQELTWFKSEILKLQ